MFFNSSFKTVLGSIEPSYLPIHSSFATIQPALHLCYYIDFEMCSIVTKIFWFPKVSYYCGNIAMKFSGNGGNWIKIGRQFYLNKRTVSVYRLYNNAFTFTFTTNAFTSGYKPERKYYSLTFI